MTSISVLTLDSDDIKGHLECNERRAHQIMGMAREGKFAEIIMDSFWETIDVCNDILDCEDESGKTFYEKLGRELEDAK
jgi:hypothetical protein